MGLFNGLLEPEADWKRSLEDAIHQYCKEHLIE